MIVHARGLAKRLVVSLFVNPAQFGPGEDLEAYPRNAERDAAIAERHGADVLFLPEPGSRYAPDHAAGVEGPVLARGLWAVWTIFPLCIPNPWLSSTR